MLGNSRMAELRKKTILVVDDAPENLDVVKSLLSPSYTVKAAVNGKMALKIVENRKPDLILLDIMMPEMDGYETCRRLKEVPSSQDIPVIFLTAKDQSVDEAKGFELGAADYIHKPFSPPILLARVATHLTLRQNMEDLEGAYATIKAQKDRMEAELNIGRQIQMSMIPTNMPKRREFSLHAVLEPAHEVGGDFYDFFLVDDQHYCVCVGDVSDKGVPAALFMAVSRTVIRSKASGGLSPAIIFSSANNELNRDNEQSMFVTLFLAIINIESGRFVFCNGGHPPPIILRSGGELARLRDRHGPFLGAMDGVQYSESENRLAQGDSLIIYTDGVTEAMNGERELFGDARLMSILAQDSKDGADGLVTRIVSAVRDFEGDAEQTDDTTILVFRFGES